jgi:predicted MFS family arabinose efflux permease
MTKMVPLDATMGARAGARRLALFALFLVSAFNYIDRTIVSLLQIPIKTELRLTDGQLGALTGLAFALFYATLSLPIARLADRFSRRWLIVISLALWSAMTALCGLATSFTMLVLLRIGVAIGEAGSVPASVSLIADYYPPQRRATAMSTWGLALPAGLMAGYAGTGWLAEMLGWRLAFAVVGGVGLVLAPLVMAMLAEPRRGTFEIAGTALPPPPPLFASLGILWRTRAFRYVVIAGMLHGFSQYSMMTWNAPFFARTHGLSLGTVALLMALLSGGAGAIGMFASGWLTDRLATRDARWRVWIMAAVVGLTVPLALLQYLTTSTPIAIGAATVAAATMIAYYGPILAATQSATPPTMRAFGNAVLLLCFNLFGLGLGPWLTGLLSDLLVPQAGADALRFALAIMLVPSALAALLFLYAARFFTPAGQLRETQDGAGRDA